MTSLKDKVQNAMDEGRMLVLGAQVLVGFGFTAFFHEGFEKLSRASQTLSLIALMLMLITFVLLLLPAAFHQIAERGNDTTDVHDFTTSVLEMALIPFALGLGPMYTSRSIT